MSNCRLGWKLSFALTATAFIVVPMVTDDSLMEAEAESESGFSCGFLSCNPSGTLLDFADSLKDNDCKGYKPTAMAITYGAIVGVSACGLLLVSTLVAYFVRRMPEGFTTLSGAVAALGLLSAGVGSFVWAHADFCGNSLSDFVSIRYGPYLATAAAMLVMISCCIDQRPKPPPYRPPIVVTRPPPSPRYAVVAIV